MRQPDVAVIDYGLGNLLSVRRGLEHCGATVVTTADPAEILAAGRVILPGVGAFADGMRELRRLELDGVVKEVARRGTPLLGICLGMQMLMNESEEFCLTQGLGLIPGRICAIPAVDAAGYPSKIPHIGWNALVMPEDRADWRGTVLDLVHPGDAVYFVHSFAARVEVPADEIASCFYGGRPLTAVIARDRVWGCQFHPEKSGAVGLNVLRSFLS